MRLAKFLGIAGVLAVLGATGAVVYRRRHRREWTELPPEQLRARLRARLDDTAIA